VSACAGILYALRRRRKTSTVALVGNASDRMAA
jgi:hypothetical protein